MGFLISVASVAFLWFNTVKQEVGYRIIGDLDEDGCLYVITDAKRTVNGIAPAYTWIDHPASSGTVRVQTLDPSSTSVGYISPRHLLVDCGQPEGIAELVLLPREASRGVEAELFLKLKLDGERFRGLKLETFVPDGDSIVLRISAAPGIELFDTLPRHASYVYKRGNPIQAIERPCNFGMTDGIATYLVGISAHSPNGEFVLLNMYKQPSNDAPYLLRDSKFYDSQYQWLSETRRREEKRNRGGD